jgi:hypothetical protein
LRFSDSEFKMSEQQGDQGDQGDQGAAAGEQTPASEPEVDTSTTAVAAEPAGAGEDADAHPDWQAHSTPLQPLAAVANWKGKLDQARQALVHGANGDPRGMAQAVGNVIDVLHGMITFGEELDGQ